MDRHFRCTACGKCCYGWLPLTLTEAMAQAAALPIAMVWTPLRKGASAYELTKRIGLSLRLPDRREVAVSVVPTAYIPPTMACPHLDGDGLCSIHADKPLRCRTMPFFPYDEESHQRNHLTVRQGWACDITEAAPLVYHDKRIVAPDDFVAERGALLEQAGKIRAYAERVLKTMPSVMAQLGRAAVNPTGGKVILSFGGVLSADKHLDADGFARAQIPVLEDFAARTADEPRLAEYHRQYLVLATELKRYLKPPAIAP